MKSIGYKREVPQPVRIIFIAGCKLFKTGMCIKTGIPIFPMNADGEQAGHQTGTEKALHRAGSLFVESDCVGAKVELCILAEQFALLHIIQTFGQCEYLHVDVVDLLCAPNDAITEMPVHSEHMCCTFSKLLPVSITEEQGHFINQNQSVVIVIVKQLLTCHQISTKKGSGRNDFTKV